MKNSITIMSIDNSFTFGGAIISLYHMLRATNKELVRAVVVSGQPLEYLEKKFPDCTCHHFVHKLMWVNNNKYLKFKKNWPFSQSKLMGNFLNLSRLVYWISFINVPEALKFYRIAKRHNVALLHFNNSFAQLSEIIAAKLLGVPCVAHLRGFAEIGSYNRFMVRLVDHHVAISGAIRDNLLQLGVPSERITLVHDAIDLEEFRTEIETGHLMEEFGLIPGQPTYGLFGRLVPWKGIREFLLAAKDVSEMIPEARGFVVGDVSDGDQAFYEEMQRLAGELGLADKVIFTGYRADIPEMMALMDVVVHASTLPEPFGLVIIEGMAAGKPVVATRAGGPLDIVEDGQTGYLVEVGNVKALGEAVVTLLKDISLCQAMGKKGRKRVEELFSNKLYAKKMEQIFQQHAKKQNST